MDPSVAVWRRAILTVLVTLAAMAAMASVAHAQGYSIYADCNRSEGWNPQGDENYGAYRDCGGGWLSGMRTLVTPHNDGRYANGTAAYTFNAPGGTKVVGLQWSGAKYYGVSSAGWFGGGWAFRTGMFGDNFRSIDGEADCYTHNLGACFSGAQGDPNAKSISDHHVGGLNDSVLGFYTQCTPVPNSCPAHSDGQGGHNLTRAGLVVSRMRVDLRDDADPSVGPLIGAGGWQRGTIGMRFDASDNSGIARTAVRSGGDALLADRNRPCDFYRLKPCGDPSGGDGEHTIDTRNMGDGHHVVVPEAWDAAGRWVRGTWRDLYVDNTPPVAPSNLSLDGGEGWTTSNSRMLRWAVPGGQASPIAGSEVELCKTGTSDCRSAGSSGTTGVGGMAGWDGPGDYTLRVSLRDEAGNHDPGNRSNGVHLRFDDRAPGAANPTQSNGWLNAEERAAYKQEVELANDGFVPVSGIRGYSLTTDGSEPDASVEAEGAKVSYPMSKLPEGVNVIKARSVSNAGVPAAGSRSATVRVDLTKPTASVEGAPDPAKWQGKPMEVTLRGEDQVGLSGMYPASATRPVEEGAYVAYRIDGGDLQKARGASAPVTVADEGEHTITYYAVDVAGNESETKTVHLKIDRTAPTASATADSVDPAQWQRESVTVALAGNDGEGRSGMTASPDEPVDNGAHIAYRIDTGNLIKVRGGAASFRVDADGDHSVTYYAVDTAGNQSAPGEVRFRIDKTAPHRVVFEQPGADKRRLEVTADDLPSGVGEVQIGLRRVGAVASAKSLRRAARRDPARYRRLQLRGTRRVGNRLVDCTGQRGRAKTECRRRRQAQLHRQHRIASLGEGWRMVNAIRDGRVWVAYVPDDRSLAEGVYQLEAVAQDQAGNESAGDRFRSGQPAIIPITNKDQADCCRAGGGGGAGIGLDGLSALGDLGPDTGTIDTKIAAGAVKRVKVKPKVSRKCRKPKTAAQKRKCRKAKKPRYRNQLVSSLKVKFGGKAKLKGTLTTAAGAPIADGEVDVITTPKADGQLPRLIGGVRTDKTGAFSYTAPAGTSRSVVFRFRGLGDFRRSEGTVGLLVPGSATLRSNRRRVANGQSVMFSGKVLGKPLPSRGKVVDLQAYYRGKWRTFATPRANKKGAFRFRYRFQATRRTTAYKFRARLRAESAYPYELGYSKVVGVRVRGR